MMNRRVLALSSSKAGNGAYLEAAAPLIRHFLGSDARTIAFIPFASVDTDYEAYAEKVRAALPDTYRIIAVNPHSPADSLGGADVIMTGGGNTFKLLHDLHQTDSLALIREKVDSGIPYVGWSAGANITGASISTTNDMPIIHPGSFAALAFFPFQINPHYHNVHPPGFNGETRDQRLEEFLQLHPAVPVVGLPEGTALLLEAGSLTLTGGDDAVLFRNENRNIIKTIIRRGEDLRQLLSVA